MNNLITLMNASAQEWKSLYDLNSVLPMEFSEKDDFLCLNEKPLCPIHNLTMEASLIDIEFLSFSFDALDLDIYIEWPEEEVPYINLVSITYFMPSP